MNSRQLLQSLFVPLLLAAASSAFAQLTPPETLGKAIFFDSNLSISSNQSCASCHGPAAGWTGPDVYINAAGAVYEGSVAGRFGNRKPPSVAYATPSPILRQLRTGAFVGGHFWDGRATGERLGSPAAEQALGPFLNPLEQALSSPAEVIGRVCSSSYATQFHQVCGASACDSGNENASYDCIGYAVAAYEGSAEVNQFSSKYDAVVAGAAMFTAEEQAGFTLFSGKAKCSRCHTVNARGKRALFTNYGYDNVGMPKNPQNPFYNELTYNPLGAGWIDFGLGGFLNAQGAHPEWVRFARESFGKHKVPTVRNVDRWNSSLGPKTKAYGHNGYFKTLEGIVHFYNTRDVLPVCAQAYTETEALAAGCWPLPELALNMERKLVGNLGLTATDEAALVAFLKTLSDGYVP